MPKKKKKSLLWKISQNGIVEPCYLLGTMHVNDKRAFQLIEGLQLRILECQSFAAEFNMNDLDSGKIQATMLLNEGLTLERLLKPKIYSRLAKILKSESGIDIRLLNRQIPFSVIGILTETLFNKEMPLALDAYLHRFAENHNLNILGIETFDGQLDILGKIPLDEQVQALTRVIRKFNNFRKQHLKAAKYYQDQDIFKLYKSVRKSSVNMRKHLLFDRNQLMSDRIATLSKQTSLFTAIGAGHLAGKQGVLRLLKLKGFSVKPVRIVSNHQADQVLNS